MPIDTHYNLTHIHFFIFAATVTKLSTIVIKLNEQSWFIVEDDSWPPIQPANFIPSLLLIQHKDHFQSHASNHDESFIDHSNHVTSQQPHMHPTKDPMKILAPFEDNDKPQLILVEGPPEIGKPVLLKEIAYGENSKHCKVLI